jgi:hypothetical protein
VLDSNSQQAKSWSGAMKIASLSSHHNLTSPLSPCRRRPLPPISKPIPIPIPHSTRNPLSRCHSSMPTPLYCSLTTFFPSGQRTHSGFESAIIHTISFGTGSSLSIADAKGWIRWPHCASQTQSMALQMLQKERWELQGWGFVRRSLTAVYCLLGRISAIICGSCRDSIITSNMKQNRRHWGNENRTPGTCKQDSYGSQETSWDSGNSLLARLQQQ